MVIVCWIVLKEMMQFPSSSHSFQHTATGILFCNITMLYTPLKMIRGSISLLSECPCWTKNIDLTVSYSNGLLWGGKLPPSTLLFQFWIRLVQLLYVCRQNAVKNISLSLFQFLNSNLHDYSHSTPVISTMNRWHLLCLPTWHQWHLPSSKQYLSTVWACATTALPSYYI
jgi:hypothetical protein